MAQRGIVGPVLRDLDSIGLTGTEVFIASAFYSWGPLKQIVIEADRVVLMVRLNMKSLQDWAAGLIAPDALLAFIQRMEQDGHEVRLFAGPQAHAKVYLGSRAGLIGSANLTTRGFSGIGHEVLWKDSSANARKQIRSALRRYEKTLIRIHRADLEEFVAKNAKKAKELKKKLRIPAIDETRVPEERTRPRPARLGGYEHFKTWLAQQNGAAAKIVLDRANGQGNLSGHIFRNFYGLRQFLLARPRQMTRFRMEVPESYKLSKDGETESELAEFVRHEANDEANFSLDKWKTYLPSECGGRADKHGGTIGNLNRMLPLVSQYLGEKLD